MDQKVWTFCVNVEVIEAVSSSSRTNEAFWIKMFYGFLIAFLISIISIIHYNFECRNLGNLLQRKIYQTLYREGKIEFSSRFYLLPAPWINFPNFFWFIAQSSTCCHSFLIYYLFCFFADWRCKWENSLPEILLENINLQRW